MTYTLVTLGLILLTGIVFLPRFKLVLERQIHAVNFFLTLVATLVGVLLAIAISNFEENRKEKQDVAKLILASIGSVETSREYSQLLFEHYQSLSTDDVKRPTFFTKNILPYPDYLDVFISQTIVSKNLSSAGLSDLNELLINLKRSKKQTPALYINILNRTEALLQTELRNQQGNIDYQDLELKLDAIEAQPFPE